MKVLVVDKDPLISQMITSALGKAPDVDFILETDKHKALELHREKAFDAVFVNPKPIRNAAEVVRLLHQKKMA